MNARASRFGTGIWDLARRVSVAALIGVAFLLGAGNAQASETLDRIKSSGELRVGTGIYPPYTIQQPDGSIIGLEAELFERLAKELGVKLRYIVVGWDIIAAGVGTGKYDMTTGLLVSEERAKVVDYATTPLYSVGQVWMVRSDNPKIKSFVDLNSPDVTIIISTGGYEDAATQKMLPKAKLKRVPGASVAQEVAEVMAGRVDANPLETPLNTALYKEEYGDQVTFYPDIGHPAIEVPSAWTLKKGDKEFQTYLSDFLARLIADGTMDSLKKKYLQKQYIQPQ
jgi:polar amino acid transport system substrate-binding protein